MPLGLDPGALEDADVVIVAVRIPIGSDGTANLEAIESAFASLAEHSSQARLILVSCTLPVGTTRRLAKNLAKSEKSPHTIIAHIPERMRLEDQSWTIKSTPHLVGGIDSESTHLASNFIFLICDQVFAVSVPEVSELSKLLENNFLAVNISLISEVTAIANYHGISSAEVAVAAATKPFGYFPFAPGPGSAGIVYPTTLSICALRRRAGFLSGVLDGASVSSRLMPVCVVDHLEHLAKIDNLEIPGAKVLLVGMGFKVGSHDITDTPARHIAGELIRRQATPVYVDSEVPELLVDEKPIEQISISDLGGESRFSLGIILSGDRNVRADVLCQAVDCLLDTGGGAILQGELMGAYTL